MSATRTPQRGAPLPQGTRLAATPRFLAEPWTTTRREAGGCSRPHAPEGVGPVAFEQEPS
jgi:hypothetical protein